MHRSAIPIILPLLLFPFGNLAMADDRISVVQAGPRLLTSRIEQLSRTARQPVLRAPDQFAQSNRRAVQGPTTRQAAPTSVRVIRDLILDFGMLSEDIPIFLPTVGSGVRVVAR